MIARRNASSQHIARSTPETREGLHGDRLARHFGIRTSSSLTVRRPGGSAMMMTRLHGCLPARIKTVPVKPDPAYSIVLQLQPLQHHELWLGGRLKHTGPVPAGAVSALSFADLPRSEIEGSFEALQFYVPESLLEEFSQEEGLSRPTGLSWPRAEPDPTATALGALLLPAIIEPDPGRTMYVEHLALAFLAHATSRYGATRPVGPVSSRNGLAPWQERRAKEMMRGRLATALTITEVSRACNLSPSYFAAAFRRSTGRSPHRFLSELRVTEAEKLMLTTELPLADVAGLCGFGDQSYFTRVFSNIVGASPGQWRRARQGA